MTRAPVLCLHAALSSGAQWRPLEAALAGSHALVTPDFFGDGRSAAPADQDWRDVIEIDTAIALEQLEQLGAPAYVIGHSYGGVIAIELARLRPDAIRGLLLIEPVTFELLRFAPPALRATAADVLDACRRAVEAGALERGAEIFVDFWNGAGAWAALPAKVRAVMARGMRKVVAGWSAIASAPCASLDETRLAVPVDVAAGSCSPAVSAWMSAQWLERGRALERIDGAGHLAPVTHAQALAAIVTRVLAPEARPARASSRAAS